MLVIEMGSPFLIINNRPLRSKRCVLVGVATALGFCHERWAY